MPKAMLDAVKAREQFQADLDAMNAGRKDGAPPPKERMQMKNFGLAEHRFRRWSAELTEAQSLQDAMDPTFWVDQARQIIGHDKSQPKGRGDIIEVRKLDTGLYAELVITEITPTYLRTVLVRASEPEQVVIPEDAALTTKWNAGTKCHEVVRKADNAVMQGGFQTKAAAAKWIDEHLKAMAA